MECGNIEESGWAEVDGVNNTDRLSEVEVSCRRNSGGGRVREVRNERGTLKGRRVRERRSERGTSMGRRVRERRSERGTSRRRRNREERSEREKREVNVIGK